MAYNEGLADDIRAILSDRPNLVVKKMFGGIGFMLNGNMACGVSGDALMARVTHDEYETALKQPCVRVFPNADRPMRGWLLVDPAGLARSLPTRRSRRRHTGRPSPTAMVHAQPRPRQPKNRLTTASSVGDQFSSHAP